MIMADYCTIANVKMALDITGNQYDTQLTRIVTAVSRWIDEKCEIVDKGFAQDTDATRYFDPQHVDGKSLWIDMPLLTVTTLTNGDGTVISSSDYRLWPYNSTIKREIRLKSSVDWIFDADELISVEGKWGYSTSIPSPVSEAAIIMSAWLHKRYLAGLADASASIELGQLIYSKPAPEQAISLLQPWLDKRMLV